VAERQILRDPIHIRFIQHFSTAQTAAALRTFALEQMPFASARTFHFSGAGDFETLCYCFPRFDTFGSSHKLIVLLKRARNIECEFLGSKWQFF
jgi:hypothetical protein